jgi:membrane-associated phospholipid phosphatase
MSTTRFRLGLTFALLALSSSVTLSGTARADSPQVEWNEAWPRFRTSEAIVTGAMLLPIAGALFLYPNPNDNLHGGFLFDNAVRDALVLDSREGRNRAASLSNPPYFGMLAFPLLVDTALVTWGIHGAGDVALEMLAMDLEAYALTGGIALTLQKLGRVRPVEKGCRIDPNYSSKCGNPNAENQSFMSGHAAIAFAGAGLTCAHHRHLPLYGGGLPDLAICVLGLTAASTTGVLRVMSDNHYASDVLLGAGVGILSGYLLPEWLHYGFGDAQAARRALPVFHPEGSTFVAVVAPQLGAGYAGVTLTGGY